MWTEVSATSFVCRPEGNFSLQLGIPANASWHIVEATTIDLGGNSNSTNIEVLYQEWLDWAIDDAEAGGSTLYWGIGLIIGLIVIIASTVVLVNRRRSENNKSDESMERGSDWLDEMLEETTPLQPDSPLEPLPEEEELRAWARGERDVKEWRDRIPDDDILDVD